MKLRYFEKSVQFVQKVKFIKPTYILQAHLEFGACNDENCMPPTSVDISKSGKSPAVDGSVTKDEGKLSSAAAAAQAKAIADSIAVAQAAMTGDTAAAVVAVVMQICCISHCYTFSSWDYWEDC